MRNSEKVVFAFIFIAIILGGSAIFVEEYIWKARLFSFALGLVLLAGLMGSNKCETN